MFACLACLAWHMIQTVVHVNAGGNQLKAGISKSVCCLQMPHFFVVANIWRAHESQKRAWAQGTNTIFSLGLAQQISQMLSDDVEAEATGTADTADECELALFYESFLTLSSQLYSFVSQFSSLKVSVMSEQWLTANRNSWIPTTGIFLHALSYALVVVLLMSTWKYSNSLMLPQSRKFQH